MPVIKNIRLDRGKFAREKHSSLFCISASDEKTLDQTGKKLRGANTLAYSVLALMMKKRLD